MLLLFFLNVLFLSNPGIAADKLDQIRLKGGTQFTKCYFCHSLKPSVHLTGPSLANTWNAKAASNSDYKLYSDSLKKSGLIWDEKTLLKWLSKPSDLVHGTTMVYTYDGDKVNLKNLIEFLKVAMGPNGYETVLSKQWIVKEFADGQVPKSRKTPLIENIVEKIEYCQSVFTIYTKDKKISKHWDQNINLRIAHSDQASESNGISIWPTGSMGDRFVVVFPSHESLKKEIKPCPN